MRSPGADTGDMAELNRIKLMEEFSSVLDESLIVLIANERDLVKDYADIRHILNELAEPARAEAATGFDPSGLGCADLEALRLDETTTSGGNGNGLDSPGEYATTISDYSDQPEAQRLTERTNLTDDEKIEELKLLFRDTFRDHTLRYVLRQVGGDLDQAFDELLNRQFLADEGLLPKGVDGFFTADEAQQPSSKAKARRNKNGNAKRRKQTVAIEYKSVSSATAGEELECAKDFARPTDARGAALKRHTASPAPAPAAATLTRSATTTAQPARPSPSTIPADFGAADLRAAAALRRMGPLGRQGAAVYLDRAREARGAFTAHASHAAEQHVDGQSTDTMIDLHGVVVMDGVRIAKQRVWSWWNGLGENRRVLAREPGFTIVTGVGKHSAGGVSRLRQAVGVYLRNDGWRVETLTGRFHVTGRV
ncbi:hypothetical protein C8A05DRAFT_33902 [Staphylotrichum tortipilum]|uniref:Smr domain-containing protein n=1 Tax=Staphylotrichum tortipilum TaxID=2831512 RepID=A0AAN6MLX0_9PEZI|nr:hypothetical protein C8A05DRAFT_33902 [Staphylotrichum longicolle]